MTNGKDLNAAEDAGIKINWNLPTKRSLKKLFKGCSNVDLEDYMELLGDLERNF
tara:strand:- start:281 stop:442 length:162 start_codon:yes stop_codon:yes gene_type:complete